MSLVPLLFASAAALQVGVPSLPVQDDPIPGLAKAVDALVEAQMAESHLPGVAVVVVQNGRTILKRGYGLADVETGRKVDPDKTLFRIASVSKALTCLAVTRLVQEGKLSFDDDVTKFTGGVQNLCESEAPVTLWNLVTHTGGFDQVGGRDRHIAQFQLPLAERKALRPSLETYLSSGKLRRVTPAGTLFRYDTYGITLAGLAIERATELPFRDAMRSVLFDRIGMADTFVEVDEDRFRDLAVGYGWVNGRYVPQPYEVYVTTPASSIDATPADMGRLLEALTGGGANAHGRLFDAEVNASVLGPQYRPHPRFPGITHGLWESLSIDIPYGYDIRSVGHGGTNLGFRTHFEVYPELNLGVVVVCNRDAEAGGGWVRLGGQLSRVIVDELTEDPPRHAWLAAAPGREVDLSPYAGNYYSGVHCRSCTDEEFRRGAWRRRDPRVVSAGDGFLRMRDEEYLPTAEDDVFVRRDGKRELLFGRDGDGAIAFMVDSTEPSTLERIDD